MKNFFLLIAACCYLSSYPLLAQNRPAISSFNSDTAFYTQEVIRHLAVLVKDNDKIQLSWEHDPYPGDGFLSIERSFDGNSFEVVGVVKCKPVAKQYDWMDEAPSKGKNFYRLHIIQKDGTAFYSDTVATTIFGDISFTFYPNPVENALIVRTEHAAELQILDAFGKVRYIQQLQQGPQIVSVGFLEKGVYLLRVSDKDGDRPRLERLVKK